MLPFELVLNALNNVKTSQKTVKPSNHVSEKPVGPCNVNKVNNDRAALQCITTGEK